MALSVAGCILCFLLETLRCVRGVVLCRDLEYLVRVELLQALANVDTHRVGNEDLPRRFYVLSSSMGTACADFGLELLE